MSFTSFTFWVALVVLFAGYHLVPSKAVQARNYFLLAASYLLYWCWHPYWVLSLLYVTGVTYVGGRILDGKRSKTLAWLFSILALLPLVFFKYCYCLGDAFSYVMPIGLSFFTFQALGYLLDVYRNKCSAERSVTDYALFVSFFPQIASGPISRASDFLPQVKAERAFEYSQCVLGLKEILFGVFAKMVIADRLGLYVSVVFDNGNYAYLPGWNCLLGVLFFSLQIYADFYGYSSIAVGVARLFGFNLVQNFNHPYLALSVSEFWHRWHISLSTWLRDYVYIPLGGSHCSRMRNYFNIMVTFLVSGMWHGAGWNFIVWGGLHGLAQCVEKMLGVSKKDTQVSSVWKTIPKIVLTFCIVSFFWIFFRASSLHDAFRLIQHLGSNLDTFRLDAVKFNNLLILAGVIPVFIFVDIYWKYFKYWLMYLVLFCMIIAFGVLNSGQFIYVNF